MRPDGPSCSRVLAVNTKLAENTDLDGGFNNFVVKKTRKNNIAKYVLF